MRTLHPKMTRMAVSLAAASLSAVLFSGVAFAQTSDPINLDSIPVKNLVIRIPAGMTITYSPKIMLEAGNVLPSASVGSPYSFDFKTKARIINDDAPDMNLATWSLLTPGPSGLSLSPSGVLSGTPIGDGSYTFEVMATYKTSTETQVYVMEVTLDVAVALAGATPPPGVVGQVYAGFDPRSLVQVSGDPSFNVDAVTWSVKSGSTLPAGLALNMNTGLISGTPTASFSGPVTLVATYKGESGERAYEFTVDLNIGVSLATGTPIQGVVGQVYGGFDPRPLLEVTGDPDFQMSSVTWSVASGTLPAGLALDAATGLVSGTPSAGASNTVTLRASYKDKNGTRSYSFVTLDIKVALAAATPPVGVVNAAYSFDPKSLLSVTGDPAYMASSVTWSLKSGSVLPVGLSLNPSTGLISGTPTQTHSGPATLVATYRGINGEQTYAFNVNFDVVVALEAATPPEAVVGVPYSGFNLQSLLSVTGDPNYNINAVTWSLASGALPAGLTLDAESGSISGTPTTAGVSTATFRATYTSASGTQVYNFVTINIGISLAVATAPEGIVGVAYPGFNLRNYLTVTGDTSFTSSTPVAWSVVSGTLPAGLTLNTSTGVISGTPTTAGTSSVTLRASYKGKNGDQAYTIKANFNNMKMISTGFSRTCAITVDGGVKCWGKNSYGQIIKSPTLINGLESGVKSIHSGWDHVCAILDTGGLKCWGSNQYGQLGDGNYNTGREEPAFVSGLESGVKEVAAGATHTCALLNTGELRCWGYNMYGEVGDGTKVLRSSPTTVSGLASGVSAVTAGANHTCAILSTGILKCWGNNSFVQLGDGTSLDASSPTSVIGLSSKVISVKAGGSHTCAILSTGELKCWGRNMEGQLGDNTTSGKSSPNSVYGMESGAKEISLGSTHTCAITGTGGLRCWGDNMFGQLGDGTTTNRKIPTDIYFAGTKATAVSGGGYHTCARVESGELKCWGRNNYGQLGNGTLVNQSYPISINN